MDSSRGKITPLRFIYKINGLGQRHSKAADIARVQTSQADATRGEHVDVVLRLQALDDRRGDASQGEHASLSSHVIPSAC